MHSKILKTNADSILPALTSSLLSVTGMKFHIGPCITYIYIKLDALKKELASQILDIFSRGRNKPIAGDQFA